MPAIPFVRDLGIVIWWSVVQGKKQRTHEVKVEGDDVFVKLDQSSEEVASDHYANMGTAQHNRQSRFDDSNHASFVRPVAVSHRQDASQSPLQANELIILLLSFFTSDPGEVNTS
jgi:hypothetical protein